MPSQHYFIVYLIGVASIQISIMDPQRQQQPPNETVPQLQSAPSLHSIDSMNHAQSKQQKNANEQDGLELQVVQSKAGKGINHEQIMRMFNQQMEREERQREEIEKRRMEMRNKVKDAPKPSNKRSIIQQKKATRQQAIQQALSQKSARIRKLIESNCKKYHIMFRPSVYDTKFMRFRFQCKEKLFINLCFGIEELRQLLPNELSEIQKQILTQDSYTVLKKLVTIIDAEMCKILNKGDKNEVSRQYKLQWQTLANNIKDETNFELKRKILSRTFDCHKIAVADQMDFFTQAKRDELLEKQKRFVAEFTVQKAIIVQPSVQVDIQDDRKAPEPEKPKQQVTVVKRPSNSSVNRYIQQSSLQQIEQLLSDSQLNKMLLRLEQDLQGKSQSLLIKNFKEIFRL